MTLAEANGANGARRPPADADADGDRGSAGKLPALAVAAIPVGLAVITRLGGADGYTPPSTPAPTAVAVRPTPTPEPTRPPIVTGHLAGIMRRSADGLTYLDGIPTGIGGVAVYRVRDVLLVPLGRTMLVGGWYLRRECDFRFRNRCASPTLSDVPLRSDARTGDLTTSFVALSASLLISGAHIVLATVESDPQRSIRHVGACQPRLRVLQQIWSVAGPTSA